MHFLGNLSTEQKNFFSVHLSRSIDLKKLNRELYRLNVRNYQGCIRNIDFQKMAFTLNFFLKFRFVGNGNFSVSVTRVPLF